MQPAEASVPELWTALGNIVNSARKAADERDRLLSLGCKDAAYPLATRYARLHELMDELLWEIGTRDVTATLPARASASTPKS